MGPEDGKSAVKDSFGRVFVSIYVVTSLLDLDSFSRDQPCHFHCRRLSSVVLRP